MNSIQQHLGSRTIFGFGSSRSCGWSCVLFKYAVMQLLSFFFLQLESPKPSRAHVRTVLCSKLCEVHFLLSPPSLLPLPSPPPLPHSLHFILPSPPIPLIPSFSPFTPSPFSLPPSLTPSSLHSLLSSLPPPFTPSSLFTLFSLTFCRHSATEHYPGD